MHTHAHMCAQAHVFECGVYSMHTYGDQRLVLHVFLRWSLSYFTRQYFPLNPEVTDHGDGHPRSPWNPAFVSKVLGLQATYLALTRAHWLDLRSLCLHGHFPSCTFCLLNNLVCDFVQQAWEVSSHSVSQSSCVTAQSTPPPRGYSLQRAPLYKGAAFGFHEVLR